MTKPHSGTASAQRVFADLAVVVSRHLGPVVEEQRREFEAICPDGEAALEMLAFWPAHEERRSLVDLALDDVEAHLRRVAGAKNVERDRLAGNTNVRILADGLTQEVAVFGPGGDEVGDRLLVTVLGPCR